MQIDELRTTPFDKIRHPTIARLMQEELGNELYSYGFERIGQGGFGHVYSHKNLPYVLKIFAYDTAYIDYVKLCMANPNNPYFPKFRGKVISFRQKDVYAIRMEKLTKFNYFSKNRSFEYDQICYYINFGKGGLIEWHKATQKPITIVKNKLLMSALYKIKGLNYGIDMHEGNVMMRGDNQLVIIDPVV